MAWEHPITSSVEGSEISKPTTSAECHGRPIEFWDTKRWDTLRDGSSIRIPPIKLEVSSICRRGLRSIAFDTCELITMSTPLSTVQNQLRKRVGFNANTDRLPSDGDRILDEQGTADLCRTLQVRG